MANAEATPEAKHLTVRCQFCDTWNRVDAARAADRPKCGSCGRPILLDRPFSLNDETFDRTIGETEVPVFVDFYADWCGPCKRIAPMVDELAAQFRGKALVAKLDTDRSPKVSMQLNIRSIPASIVFHGGVEVARQTGAVPKPVLEQMLAKAVA